MHICLIGNRGDSETILCMMAFISFCSFVKLHAEFVFDYTYPTCTCYLPAYPGSKLNQGVNLISHRMKVYKHVHNCVDSTQSKSTSMPCAVQLFKVLEARITMCFYLYKAIQNAVSMQISVALSCGQERVPVVSAVTVASHRQKTKSESQKHNGAVPQTRHKNH